MMRHNVRANHHFTYELKLCNQITERCLTIYGGEEERFEVQSSVTELVTKFANREDWDELDDASDGRRT